MPRVQIGPSAISWGPRIAASRTGARTTGRGRPRGRAGRRRSRRSLVVVLDVRGVHLLRLAVARQLELVLQRRVRGEDARRMLVLGRNDRQQRSGATSARHRRAKKPVGGSAAAAWRRGEGSPNMSVVQAQFVRAWRRERTRGATLRLRRGRTGPRCRCASSLSSSLLRDFANTAPRERLPRAPRTLFRGRLRGRSAPAENAVLGTPLR